jgi:hypothetical protein
MVPKARGGPQGAHARSHSNTARQDKSTARNGEFKRQSQKERRGEKLGESSPHSINTDKLNENQTIDIPSSSSGGSVSAMHSDSEDGVSERRLKEPKGKQPYRDPSVCIPSSSGGGSVPATHSDSEDGVSERRLKEPKGKQPCRDATGKRDIPYENTWKLIPLF